MKIKYIIIAVVLLSLLFESRLLFATQCSGSEVIGDCGYYGVTKENGTSCSDLYVSNGSGGYAQCVATGDFTTVTLSVNDTKKVYTCKSSDGSACTPASDS